MANYVDAVCSYCGQTFKKDVAHYNWNLKNGRKNFCSKECADRAKDKKIKVKCLECGKEFKVAPNRKETVKFCSRECIAKYKSKKQENICEYCGKPFLVKQCSLKNKRGHYCSRECYYNSFKLNNKMAIFSDRIEVYVNSKKHGLHTILLDKDAEKVAKNNTFGIYKHHIEGVFYARIYVKKEKKSYALHRYIMNCPDGMVVDHINHNTLDNRTVNLRICTPATNSLNKINTIERNKKILEYKEKYYLNEVV